MNKNTDQLTSEWVGGLSWVICKEGEFAGVCSPTRVRACRTFMRNKNESRSFPVEHLETVGFSHLTSTNGKS